MASGNVAGGRHRDGRNTQGEPMTSASAIETAVVDRAGKYLTFMLEAESYGLEILKVREIIGVMEITGVPRTPDYVLGVINLRGKVVPVVDLRTKFGLPTTETTEETCIIVVQIGDVEIGIQVDRVSEVLDVQGADIEDAPSFGPEVDTNFILGMGKVGERVTMLLDIDNVLGDGELADLASMA